MANSEQKINGHGDGMPVWIRNAEIDPTWIERRLALPCISCHVEDVSNGTRRGCGGVARNGATLRLNVVSRDGDRTSFIMKQVPQGERQLSVGLGLAREAFFYNELAPQLQAAINDDDDDDSAPLFPRIHYSWGDMSSGGKVIVMEDLTGGFVDSGILFGPGNPNNWDRNLDQLISQAFDAGDAIPSSKQVTMKTFVGVARIHAKYWRDSKLLNSSWLRGSEWIQGKSRESWEYSQMLIERLWKTYTEREANNSISWDPLVRKLVEVSLDGISWDAQLQRINVSTHWTLVHGDFWPGNVLWSFEKGSESGSLRLIDWEMVGLGSGPHDLGQYILSNMDPSERRACEVDVVRAYYDELVRLGVREFSWDQCWSEYRIGGLERWLWFLIYFAGQDPGTPMLKWAQFFHDQIAAFVDDHNIKVSDITQPRP